MNIRIVLIELEHKTIEKGFSIVFGKSLIIVGSPPLTEGAINNAIHITGIRPIIKRIFWSFLKELDQKEIR